MKRKDEGKDGMKGWKKGRMEEKEGQKERTE